MRSLTSAICGLLLLGTAFSECPEGTTGKDPNCQECPKGTTTTSGSGDNKPCNQCAFGYHGKAPNCKKCSGSYEISTITLKDGSQKCVCSQGFEGSYPSCKPCKSNLNTDGPGNGKKCGCYQASEGDWFDATYGCSKCNTSGKYYGLLHKTWPRRLKVDYTSVCVRCVGSGTKTSTVNGRKVCTCNAQAGYALKAGGVTNLYLGGEFCIKCSGQGKTVDSKGRCMCKEGYGISRDLSEEGYCIRCGGTSSYVDSEGYCQCRKPYAWSITGNKCVKCTAAGYQVYKAGMPTGMSFVKDGSCICRAGWHGSTAFYTYEGAPKGVCKKCAAGQTSELRGGNPLSVCTCDLDKRSGFIPGKQAEEGCVCRWGFKKVPGLKKCQYNSYCKAGHFRIEIWSGSALPRSWSGKNFPRSVLSHKPTASYDAKAGKSFNLTVVPSAVDRNRFVARIRRCACLHHADAFSSFFAHVSTAGKGGVKLEVDGSTDPKCGARGAYHDQNTCGAPGVNPVLPLNATLSTSGSGKSVRLKFPQYTPSSGPWLSGMDYIPVMEQYEACHNITLKYWHTGGPIHATLTVPKATKN